MRQRATEGNGGREQAMKSAARNAQECLMYPYPREKNALWRRSVP
jgi:hypothetical protein